MDTLKQDELFFFEQHREAYSLYEALEEELIRRFRRRGYGYRRLRLRFPTAMSTPASHLCG